MKNVMFDRNIRFYSRRFYKRLDVLDVLPELNAMAEKFKDKGWKLHRGPLGIVILELRDGYVHYIPAGDGIEEVVFQKCPEGKGYENGGRDYEKTNPM